MIRLNLATREECLARIKELDECTNYKKGDLIEVMGEKYTNGDWVVRTFIEYENSGYAKCSDGVMGNYGVWNKHRPLKLNQGWEIVPDDVMSVPEHNENEMCVIRRLDGVFLVDNIHCFQWRNSKSSPARIIAFYRLHDFEGQ